jgi:hypothetical protein
MDRNLAFGLSDALHLPLLVIYFIKVEAQKLISVEKINKHVNERNKVISTARRVESQLVIARKNIVALEFID